jgi:hypothetical protein
MHLELVDYLLWFVPPVLQAGILIALIRRKFNRVYPYFLVYILLEIVSDCALFGVSRASYVFYYYGYHLYLVLSLAISFLVIWEILKTTSQRDVEVRQRGLTLTLFLVILFVAVCGMLLTTHVSGIETSVLQGMLSINRGLEIAQISLAGVLIFRSASLGISRRSFVYGVGLGFGLFALANICLFELLSHKSRISDLELSRFNGLAYSCACIIWLLYAIYGSADAAGFSRAQRDPGRYDSGGVKSAGWEHRLELLPTRFPIGS